MRGRRVHLQEVQIRKDMECILLRYEWRNSTYYLAIDKCGHPIESLPVKMANLLKVLLVDDEADITTIIKNGLENHGWQFDATNFHV